MGIVTVVAGLLIAFPYYTAAFYPKDKRPQVALGAKSDIKKAEFKIKSMTREGCTEHVNSEIAKVKGVINYQTSFERASSVVAFDNSKTSVASIATAINSIGYKVTSQKINNEWTKLLYFNPLLLVLFADTKRKRPCQQTLANTFTNARTV